MIEPQEQCNTYGYYRVTSALVNITHTHWEKGVNSPELAAVSDRASGAAVLRMPERTERERQRKERIYVAHAKWCRAKTTECKMKRKEQIKDTIVDPDRIMSARRLEPKNCRVEREERERERERRNVRERVKKGGKFKRLQSTAEKGKREQRKQRIWGEKVSGLISL